MTQSKDETKQEKSDYELYCDHVKQIIENYNNNSNEPGYREFTVKLLYEITAEYLKNY